VRIPTAGGQFWWRSSAVPPDGWRPILVAIKRGPVTLLYSAHDTEHNGALVLRDYLTEQEKKRPARRAAARRRSRR